MLARKSFLQFLSGGVLALLGMVTMVLVARFLGPTVVGTIGYATGFAGLFLIGADLGFGQAHAKRVSEGKDLGIANGTFFAIKGILLGLSALALLAFLTLAWFLGWEVWRDTTLRIVFALMAAALFVDHLSSSLVLTFQARQEVARFNVPQLVARLAKVGLVILIVLLSLGVFALAGAYLVESFIFLLGVVWFFRSYPIRKPDRVMLKSYWAYTLPFLVMTPLSLLGENLDKVLLKAFTNFEQVGYYVAAQSFMAVIPLILAKPAMSVFFPHVSRLSVRDALPAIRESTNLVVRYLSILTLPVVVLLIAFRAEIIHFFLGEQFLPASSVFAVAALAVYVISVVRPYLNVLYGIERHQFFPHVSVALLAVTIIGYAFFIPSSVLGLPALGLGATGAALTVLIAWTLDGIIKVRMLTHYTGIRFYWRIFLHLAAGLLLYGSIVAGRLVTGQAALNPGILVGALLYVGVLWLAREISRADLHYLRQATSPRSLVTEVSDELGIKRPL